MLHPSRESEQLDWRRFNCVARNSWLAFGGSIMLSAAARSSFTIQLEQVPLWANLRRSEFVRVSLAFGPWMLGCLDTWILGYLDSNSNLDSKVRVESRIQIANILFCKPATSCDIRRILWLASECVPNSHCRAQSHSSCSSASASASACSRPLVGPKAGKAARRAQ